MIISAKKKKGQTEQQDEWQMQTYTDKITERSVHIQHSQKEKKEKKSIYKRKE